jgi:hypothetical protein
MRHLSLLAVPLFAACVVHAVPADTTFTSTNRPTREMRARAFDSVEVYTSSVPPRPYHEVGIIRSTAFQSADAVNGLHAKAAEVGCDGVIVTSTGMNQYDRTVYNGACFLYPDDTTWRAPELAPAPIAPPSATPTTTTTAKPKATRSPECERMLAELRAAPNDAKPRLSQRVPPECFAPPTSPGS